MTPAELKTVITNCVNDAISFTIHCEFLKFTIINNNEGSYSLAGIDGRTYSSNLTKDKVEGILKRFESLIKIIFDESGEVLYRR